MESLAPVAGRRDGAAGRPDARRHPRAGARPRAGPQPRPRPGRHQRGVPRAPAGRPPPAAAQAPDRPRRRVVPRRSPTSASTPSSRARPWWTVSPFGLDDERRPAAASARATCSGGRRAGCSAARPAEGLPRRPRAGGRRHRAAGWPTGYRVVVVQPGPRPGPADGRGARRARRRRRGWSTRLATRRPGPAERRRHRDHAARSTHGFVDAGQPARGAHRRRPVGPEGVDPRHAQDAGPAQAADRPARAHGRRLRRPRAARRRPLRRDEAARGAAARPASTSSSSTAPRKRGGPPDRLYVPADALDQVTRYVGGEQPVAGPARRRATGPSARAAPARRSAQIAAELIKLYAARQATKGHAFGPDTPWQRELEDAFPFHETPDQLTTVDEVKADMRRTVPMDRLVCGDVGYGKTEIAVRAAFKAVQDGKQVAVLVPTTLLVQQHLSTFAERMSGFPVDAQGAARGSRPTRRPARSSQGLADGHGRHRDRHPPAAQPRHPDQGPRPDHRRRGAALRRRAQGADEAAAHLGRRAVDVGDADPAHPGDGDHRHPRDVDDHHPARGAAPGADLRRRLRGPPGGRRRSAASCCARARSSTSTTGCSSIEKAAAQIRRAGARGAGRRRRTARWASTSSSR